MNTPPSGCLTPSSGALSDEVAFKFSDLRKHGHNQLVGVSCRGAAEQEIPLSQCQLRISYKPLTSAGAGTACASVFAPADYWPQRLSDLFCRYKLSGQALMAHLAGVALTYLYPHALPERLFWIADATYTEKPYAHHIASVDWFHRLKHVAGRAKNLKGHCYVFAAHLYRRGEGNVRQWASVLVGALLYVKGRSIPTLVGMLAQQLRLLPTVRHLWLTDSGILSRPLLAGPLCAGPPAL